MHEFSLATDVIKLAEYEAEKNGAGSVSEITLEVGNMTGIQADALETALEILSEGSILEKAILNIVTIKGKGICPSCGREFEMENRMDTCPVCNCFISEIRGGNEFRLVSMLIEEKET
jgi:hydrogenase nickel incorporation protein HypA/HybF